MFDQNTGCNGTAVISAQVIAHNEPQHSAGRECPVDLVQHLVLFNRTATADTELKIENLDWGNCAIAVEKVLRNAATRRVESESARGIGSSLNRDAQSVATIQNL